SSSYISTSLSFLNATAPSEIYTLSLHDALPISQARARFGGTGDFLFGDWCAADIMYAPVVTRFVTYGVAVPSFAGVYMKHVLSQDRKSTRLNSSHVAISYAVFCLKKKKHK